MNKDYSKLLNNLGIKYHNLDLYKEALTHPSYLNEHKETTQASYQRLEFLGDAFLELVVSSYIYLNKKNFDEGKLTFLRQELVNEGSFAEMAEDYNFSDFILLSKGQEKSGGRNNPSILCDVFEAIAACCYLDLGFNKAKFIYTKIIKDFIKEKGGIDSLFERDSKSRLQELCQSDKRNIDYRLISETGPAHNKKFKVEVYVDGIKYGEGQGRSKKEAEQSAAKEALGKMVK